MGYPNGDGLNDLILSLVREAELKHEYGGKGVQKILDRAKRQLRQAVSDIKKIRNDEKLAACEPDSLKAIHALRPSGARKIWQEFDANVYAEKVEGALLARLAGCTLGTIVEQWPMEEIETWARQIGDPFPPVDYWSVARTPYTQRTQGYPYLCHAYTRNGLDGVPPDDDIVYTLMGLLICEEYGHDFTTADVGEAWLKYLPLAFTAEKVAIENLKAGVSWKKAGEKNNPYCQWIGADIRSDPWGYVAPGWPQMAAELAHRDAYISHRRNGIYGEMFFSAVIAAAFTVDDPVDAIKIGLTEIPQNCMLARDIRWALKTGKQIKDYCDAVKAVRKRFDGMHQVHTNNNACLTIFGLMIGGCDVTKVLSQTVAMGFDNDCTAATAGSIVGAVVGKKGVPKHWTKNFNNTIYTYINGKRRFTIDSVVRRFGRQAKKVWNSRC